MCGAGGCLPEVLAPLSPGRNNESVFKDEGDQTPVLLTSFTKGKQSDGRRRPFSIEPGSQSVAWLSSAAASGNLSEMQNLRPHFRSTESGTLGAGPLCFDKSPSGASGGCCWVLRD